MNSRKFGQRQSARGGRLARRSARSRRELRTALRFERLEERHLLANAPLISEFMASNSSTILDSFGEASDYIELHNPTIAGFNLNGWYLTDSSSNLTKWRIPNLTIPAGGYKLIFASDRDLTNPAGELHTNFKLAAEGEYLALVRPDGTTIEQRFTPKFPAQYTDLSYGLAQDLANYVQAGTTATFHVPTAADAAANWTATGFDDSVWFVGQSVAVLQAGFDADAEGFTYADGVFGTNNPDTRPDGFYRATGGFNSTGGLGVYSTTSTARATSGGYSKTMIAAAAGKYHISVRYRLLQAAAAVAAEYSEAVLTINGNRIGGGPNNSLARLTGDGTAGIDLDTNWQMAEFDVPLIAGSNTLTIGLYNSAASAVNKWGQVFFDDVGVTYSQPEQGPIGLGFDANSGFISTYYKVNTAAVPAGVSSISEVEAVIGDPAKYTIKITEYVNTVNYLGSGAVGNYGSDRAFPTQTINTDFNDFIVNAIGTVYIPSAGTWTFGVSSDDGFRLRLTDQSGLNVQTMQFDGIRGAGNTLQAFTFAASGYYDLDLLYFERNGSSELEFFAAPGAQASFNAALFDLVGNTASGGLAISGFGGAIQTDVGAALRGVNSALWARIPFTIAALDQLDALSLRVKYNDGFVAYLNGVKIAESNAPASPAWNSASTQTRTAVETAAWQNFNLTAFKHLLTTGTNVLAVLGLNNSAADTSFLVLPELIGTITGTNERYFSIPTPGGANVSGSVAFAADTKFSHDRGYYLTPFNLAITTATPGATIRYTLDGSEPTATTGIDYSAPIFISSTITVRAAAFRNGYLPSNVDTQSYLFAADVLTQSSVGQPAPTLGPNGLFNTYTTDLEGYAYGDDLFNTTNPTKANGVRTTNEGFGNGAGLKVTLGPGPSVAASGGFTKTFTLERGGTYGVWLRYRLSLGQDLAADEFGEAVLTINGTRYGSDAGTSLMRRSGNGAGGGDNDYGWQFYGFNAVLPAGTNTLRVGAYLNDADTSVNKYVNAWFDDLIVSQWPAQAVNGQVINYGMDPDIVNNAVWAPQLNDALLSIPTFVINTQLSNLFDPANGNYVHADQTGGNWERPVSFELINPDGTPGFQVDAGIRIRGGYSVANSNPKHSFRLFFREEYGDKKLAFPLFGDAGADEFDRLDIRASQNYSWSFEGSNQNAVIRDIFSRDTQRDMGQEHTRGNPYHLYINGQYWGLFETQERAEASYAESYFGDDDSDYDVVKVADIPSLPSYTIFATDGNMNAWQDLWNQASGKFTAITHVPLAPVTNLAGALAILADESLRQSSVAAAADRINYLAGNPEGQFTGNGTFPGSNPTNFVFAATGTFEVPAAGPYTFAVTGDDIFRLDITGGGNAYVLERTVPGSAGTSTLQTFNLPQGGSYDFRLIYVNLSGGAGVELSAAPGTLAPFDAAFKLIGDSAAGGFARSAMSSNALYLRSQGLNPDGTSNPAFPKLVDLDNLIDYMLVIFYTGNNDAPISNFLGNTSPNNWYGIYNRKNPDGFKFFAHDSEHSLSRGGSNRTGPFSAGDVFNKSNPQWIHQQLMYNAEYRQAFGDRAHLHLKNNGLLTTNAALARFNARAAQIDKAVVAESARWGDSKVATPYTKTTWLTAINNERNNFFPARTNTLLSQLQATTLRTGALAPLYPATTAPIFSQFGGNVALNYNLTMSGGATIYYTLDGSDPRQFGGGISPAALLNTSAVVLTESKLVQARVNNGGNWSALTQAQFYVGDMATAANLDVTEIHFNPPAPSAAELAAGYLDAGEFEFIELQNTGGSRIDLTGVTFNNGIDYTFTNASGVRWLNPGQTVVLVENLAAFTFRYGALANIAGVYSGSINNAGEELDLDDRTGLSIADFNYDDSEAWPGRADGNGSSLQTINPRGNPGEPNNWRASAEYGGSPGLANTNPLRNVVINEVLAFPQAGGLDAIELYNTTAASINIGGWYLSDSNDDYHQYRISPADPRAIIPAFGFVHFTAADFNNSGGTELNDFGLESGGDELWLTAATPSGIITRFADHVEFDRSLAGVTYGAAPNGSENFTLLQTPTLGSSNSSARVGAIVINEIHSNPAIKTEPLEYVELYNRGVTPVDLSGWRFTNGIEYIFPANTQPLAAGGYLLVSQSPTALQTKFGVTSYGPYIGRLDNEGETITLNDKDGYEQDAVDYQLGFPWPTVGVGPEFSLELVNPNLDNNLGGNWRSSLGTPVSTPILLDIGSSWNYFKGTAEPSAAAGAWRTIGFNDAAWLIGSAGFGFNDIGINTPLADMQNGYSTLYLRKAFSITDPFSVRSLLLELKYDDGVNVWINANLVVGVNVPGSELPYTATASTVIEPDSFIPFTLINPQTYLVAGTNVITVQLLNASLADDDAIFDAKLTASIGGSSGVTPKTLNSVSATNTAPQMRQVEHSPAQPLAGQDVTITVKVTDPNGVQSVNLAYQIVNPGDYIAINDPRFTNPAFWVNLAMHDDGVNGDLFAGDSIYSVVMPTSVQTHRRLIRYKITSTDGLGASVTGPYVDDPQPNFAYFVYNGVPSWTGKVNTSSPNVTYAGDMLDDTQVYQLITTRQNHVNAQSVPYRVGQADQVLPTTGQYLGEDYLWRGSLVYNGQVYDHISYRTRGGVWRYAMGKNMWKFDFNTGHLLQGVDDYGNEYDTPVSKLNFSALIQQGNFNMRGEQGLFEQVGFKLFDLAGIESPNTNFAHFRIIAGANENGGDQYSGDFQGLYLVIEQPDGNFLDEHELEDGNLYKLEGGTGTLNNQGPTQPTNKSDLKAFITGYSNAPTEAWWRANVDLASYFDYRAIVEGIHHWDIGFGKNYFYYHDPVTNKWSQLPWDLDLTWSNNYNPGGGDAEPFKAALNHPAIATEYRNRLREIRDLLWNIEQTGMMLDETARHVSTPGAASIVDADRAMWDFNPIMTSNYVNASKSGTGRYYTSAAPPGGFAGMVQNLKSWVASRAAYIDSVLLADDALVPVKPTISYSGGASYPVDGLQFQSSNYASPVSSAFAAMQWRIAKVSDPNSASFDPYAQPDYEITSAWTSPEIATFGSALKIPGGNLEVAETYRVRVRMKDASGRWSHWSNPVQFAAGEAIGTLQNDLRITEVMYNPAAPSAAELAAGFTDSDAFEFIELTNVGATALDLTGVEFKLGIEFNFSNGVLTSLQPGQYALVVKNIAAFEARYGIGLPVAGTFSGNLRNAGEELNLESPWGDVIHQFVYDDSSAWPDRADGIGSTLQIVSTAGEYNAATNWRNSVEFGGSPGANGIAPLTGIVINELLTHTDPPQSDSIEIHNSTGGTVNLAYWWISDSSDELRKFQIQPGDPRAMIPAGGYAVFNEADFNPTPNNPAANHFSFDAAHGDSAWLLKGDAAGDLWFVDDVSFRPAANGESFGRWPNETGSLYPQVSPTLGSANSGPRVGPLLISEVAYAPNAGNDEFIEIYNPTGQAVSLDHWEIGGGADFAFPNGITLGAGQVLLISETDPTAFRAKYGIPANVQIVGPFTGVLDNAGERLQLLRPDEPPQAEPNYYPLLLEDEVDYLPAAPWPAINTTSYRSLQRVGSTTWGNDPLSWSMAGATPGALPGIVDWVGGLLTFTAGSGAANSVTLNVNASTYSIADSGYPILLTDAAVDAGWSGGGSNTVSGPTALVVTIVVTLGELADSLTVQNAVNSLTLNGGGQAGDSLHFSGSVTDAGGFVLASGWDQVTATSGSLLNVGAGLVSISAGVIGTAVNPLRTQAATLSLAGNTGGIFLTETDGANVTAQVTGTVSATSGIQLTNLTGLLTIAGGTHTDAAAPIVIVSGGGIALAAEVSDANSGPVTLDPGTGVVTVVSTVSILQNVAFAGSRNLNVNPGAALTINGLRLANLILQGANSKVTLRTNGGAAGLIVIENSLTMANGSVLDINDNDLVLTYAGTGPNLALLSQIQGYVNNFYFGNTGVPLIASQGIIETGGQTVFVAVDNALTGFGDGAVGATFYDLTLGNSNLGTGFNQVIVRYTWGGDFDLNGVVDALDYSIVDANLNSTVSGGGVGGWQFGDGDFDGMVTPLDYSAIDANLGNGGPLAGGGRISALGGPSIAQGQAALAEVFNATDDWSECDLIAAGAVWQESTAAGGNSRRQRALADLFGVEDDWEE